MRTTLAIDDDLLPAASQGHVEVTQPSDADIAAIVVTVEPADMIRPPLRRCRAP